MYLFCAYKVSHVGRSFGSIVPERGLRQGDPLSSYLFLLCIKGLTALLKNFETRKLVQGIKVARNAPSISHMLFADDSYIFCKASLENADNVLQLLDIFERASRQKINVNKFSVFFSNNSPSSLKGELIQKLGFREAND